MAEVTSIRIAGNDREVAITNPQLGPPITAPSAKLIRVLRALEKLEGANEDQTVGIRLLARAIEEPLRQIVENAGEDAAVVLNAVKAGKGAYGYNAATGVYGDMLEAGILDPTKVTRLALQNAASVAGRLCAA